MDTIKKIGKQLAKLKARLILLSVIAIFCIGTIYVAAANAYTITLEIDGETSRVTTMREDAYEILKQTGIEISDKDIVDFSGFSAGTDSTIRIFKAHSFTVSDDGAATVTYTGNGSVGLALLENGIIVNDGDVLNCSVDDILAENMAITIRRAFPVKIMADGETVTVNLAGGVVSDALDKAVITIDDNDIISKSLDTPLEKDLLIKITRVDFKQRTETVEIGYETTIKKDNSMYSDQFKVEKKGVKGQQTITYNEKYVDGVVTESTAINKVVHKAPVNEVKIVGTKSRPGNTTGTVLANGLKTISRLTPPASLKLNGTVPVSYKKKIVGTASAYSGGGRTATGKSVMPGYIAVNPNQIPYHTKMWIVSNDGKYVYGYASAEDTGGFTKWTGNRATLCDLYFPTNAQTGAFGRRSVTIYIL